jgi:hypothetical protein
MVSHRPKLYTRTQKTANLEVLRNLAHETLEGELSDKKLGRLLVATNLAQCYSSGAEAVRLLHTTRGGLQSIVKLMSNKRGYVVLTAAVLRAADFAASCLRGALPRKGTNETRVR